VNDKLDTMCNRPWPNLMHYSLILLDGLSKTTINIRQDRRPTDRNLNPRLSGYKAETGTILSRRSITFLLFCVYEPLL
jgi:hypothetical protein